MIIGERFAWAHLPKTAGSATLELFRLFPELIVFGDFAETNDKHTPFRERRADVAGKTLSLNIRRLPFWVLSRAQHAARWGVWPDYEPIQMASADDLSESSFPDSRIAIFTDEGRIEIDDWLRMENLAEDFLAFISKFTDVTEERRAQVLGLPPVNAHEYDHEIRSWFSAEQIARMYKRNPVWANLERSIYGNLYVADGRGMIAT
jgi:hypothetical protein